jgi:hypothetical protein
MSVVAFHFRRSGRASLYGGWEDRTSVESVTVPISDKSRRQHKGLFGLLMTALGEV